MIQILVPSILGIHYAGLGSIAMQGEETKTVLGNPE